jgi:hypothetical protein
MSTLLVDHIAAGARYVAAVTEFRAALIDLAAHDAVVGSASGGSVPGFGALPATVTLRHTTFLPDIGAAMHDGVAERIAELTGALS